MVNIETIDIELVGSCNYRCRMCPHTAPGRESDFLKVLPWWIFTNIIDQAQDLGVHSIRLHGSGEPTLYKRLVDAVSYCRQRDLKVLVTTNGARLTAELSDQLIAADLTQLTVSATGYDRASYQHWMGEDNYDLVRENVRYYVKHAKNKCNLYHLITDPDNQAEEIEKYHTNWIDYTGADYEIWHLHNWAGNYQQVKFNRQTGEQRSCGRMFKPVLEVRAGGHKGRYAAVVACCMVLGNDSAAVLGHLDTERIEDVWNNEKYQQLRSAHSQGHWNDIAYCQGCDQLYNRPDSLVATNLTSRVYNEIKSISYE